MAAAYLHQTAAMTRKVGVIGSTTFPLSPGVGAQVVDVLRGLDGAVILTRGSGPFETFLSHAALVLGLRCFAFKGSGRDNWQRDVELIEACDELLAFFAPDTLDDPTTGTAHVVEVALAAGRPVRAASVVNGNLVWADG